MMRYSISSSIRLYVVLLVFIIHRPSWTQDVKIGLPIGHSYTVTDAKFDSSGKFLLTSSLDKKAILWDLNTLKPLKVFVVNEMIESAFFCYDDTKIILNCMGSRAYLINLETGKKTPFEGRLMPEKSGKELFHFDKKKISKWNINEERNMGKICEHNGFVQIHYLKERDQLLFNTTSQKYLIDIKTGEEIQLPESTNSYAHMFVDPNSKWAAFEYNNGKVQVYDLNSFELRCQLDTKHYAPLISFYKDDKMLICKRTGELIVHDLQNDQTIMTRSYPIDSVGWTTDARMVGDEILLVTPGYYTLLDLETAKTGVWHKIPNGGKITGSKHIAIHPDSTEILIFGQDFNDLLLYNVQTNAPKLIVNHTSPTLSAHKLDNGEKLLVSSIGNSVVIDKESGKTLLFELPPKGRTSVYDLSVKHDVFIDIPEDQMCAYSTSNVNGDKFVLIEQSGKVQLRNSETLEVIKTFGYHVDSTRELIFSETGNLLYTYCSDNSVRIWDVETGGLVSELNHPEEVEKIYPGSDDDYVLTISGTLGSTILLWNSRNGELTTDFTEPGNFGQATLYQNKYVITTNEYSELNVYDLHGEVLNTIRFNSISKPPFEDKLTHNLFVLVETELFNRYELFLIDPLKGSKKKVLSLNGWVENIHQSADGKFLFVQYYNNSFEIYHVDTYNFLYRRNDHTDNIYSVEFGPDSDYMVTTSYDGSIILWSVEDGEKLIQRFQFDNDPNKWVHIHPSGLFDASPEAMELMYWTKGLEIIEFAQLKDRYWVPGLWEKVMKGEVLPDVRSMQELKLQPEVMLGEVLDGKLPVTLVKRDGGYGKVSVFINGKEIISDARGDQLDPEKDKQTIYIDIKDHPYLMNGKNKITVQASSEDGFVQGRGEEIDAFFEEAEVNDPQFFAVVVGIGDYVNDAINLNYSVPDARAIATSVELGARNLFGEERTFVYTITSDSETRPTKSNIKRTFDEISNKAQAEDVILVYLSGHGVTWGGDQGDFYFLTADATAANKDAYNDPAIRENNTISTNEWVEWLKTIPALKQVMIIDACGSGKAVDNLLAARDVEASQIKAIDRMKDRTGMFIISGCAADAVSYEASQYGQGLLTYSVLQAMKGAALRENKFIDVDLILNHARETVPVLARGVGGIQKPQLLIPKGGSFDIGMLNDSDKAAIPLAEAKRVFVRSTLVDKKKFRDVLGLGALLDSELSSVSSRGAESNIVFFDAIEYGNACQISGGYLQKESNIEASITITCGQDESGHELNAPTSEELIDKIIKLIDEME